MQIRRVCVFCGSSVGAQPAYRAAALALGELLARQGIELIYGGGRVGLMGVIADAVLAGGGRVTGIIPEFLATKEIGHRGVSELIVVPSMHVRKALMAERADAFIALPGGFGTLEELAEIVTWAQLGLHRKPIGLLNTAHFYDALIAFAEHAIGEQFVRADYRTLLIDDADPERLLQRMSAYTPPDAPKWLTPERA